MYEKFRQANSHRPWTGKLLHQWFTPKTMPPFLRSAAMIDGSRAHSIVVQAAKDHPLSADCFFTEMSYGNSAGAPEFYIRPKGIAYISGGSDDVPLPDLADEVSYDPKLVKELQRQAAVVSPEYLDVNKDAQLKAEQAVGIYGLTPVLLATFSSHCCAYLGWQCQLRYLSCRRPLCLGD